MAKKIAFIRKSAMPLASENVARVLQREFPQFPLEIIDVRQLLTRRKDIALINSLHMWRKYGVEILLRRKTIKECFFRTTYLFYKIKTLMTEKLAVPDYVFSFQMQSLFDASYEHLPHFVYTDHTNLTNLMYPISDRNKLFSQSWISLEKTIYQNACQVFTRSSNITRSIVEQYGCDPRKVTCVYAGSNVGFRHEIPENDRFRNKNILFVGIDWKRKGGPELVEAFRRVLCEHPDARLTIVGCSPQVDVPNCEVIGRVAVGEVRDYLRRASIFCLPTKLEPFGIALIEAFSFQLPVVATQIGAIPDFVLHGENGFLVEPGEVANLAQTLTYLLDHPDQCKAFGRKGYDLVQERYSWEKVGQRLRDGILTRISDSCESPSPVSSFQR